MSMATITHSSSSSLFHFLSPPLPLHSVTSPRRFPSKLSASASSSSFATAPLNPVIIDKSSLIIAEATSDEQLLAATCLRVRSFYEFKHDSYSPEDHKKYLVEREFKGLKERVAGHREGFRKVSCINASLPLSHVSSLSEDLSATCKLYHVGSEACLRCYLHTADAQALLRGVVSRHMSECWTRQFWFPHNDEQRVVVGTLDLNQCVKLPDEMAGRKPQGIGTDFARAYLSNVCVAQELHKNGLGFVLISEAKSIAEQWGISDLYVHVSIDNEPAKKLYYKSGFVYESDEPAWEARFLNRPRRLLLWLGLPHSYNL